MSEFLFITCMVCLISLVVALARIERRYKKMEDELNMILDCHVRKNVKKDMDTDLKINRMYDEIKYLKDEIQHMKKKDNGLTENKKSDCFPR